MYALVDKNEKLTKIKHFLPVIPVYFVIITVILGFTYCYVINDEFSVIKIITIPLFYFLALMVIICHLYSMFTHPGKVIENTNNYVTTDVKNNNKRDDPLYCNKCCCPRPERSHHCKICRQCILKMDHHCPWIANCVGLYNQKYFYLFLFYAMLGDGLAFVCLIIRIFSTDNLFSSNKNYNTLGEIFYELRVPLINIFSASIALAMTISIGILFIFQTGYILHNTTTIETKIYKLPNDSPWYSKDNKFNNFKSVLGEGCTSWFLPNSYVDKTYNHRLIGISKLNSNYLCLTDNYDDNI